MRSMNTFLCTFASLVVAGLLALPAAAQPTYGFTALDDNFGVHSQAYRLNSTGQIIGTSTTANDESHSVHWHNEVFTDLHGTVHFELEHLYRLYNEDFSEAYAISNGDQVVGTARVTIECDLVRLTITNAFILRPAVLTDLATPYPGDALTNLGTFGHPCAVYDSAAVGISNNNHVVGWSDVDEGGTMHAFLVTPVGGKWYVDDDDDLVNDLMIDLGTMDQRSTASSGTAVNDSGEVTGWCYVTPGYLNPDTGLPESGYHAFLVVPVDTDADGLGDQWFVDGGGGVENALMTDLGTLGGNNSWGRDINNDGDVVGESDTGDGTTRAFLYRDGEMIDLGVLDTTSGAASRNSSAAAINDDGQIVGWAENASGERRAFVWEDGVMYDLNDRLLATDHSNFVLNEARDINSNGQVIGWGYVGTDETRSFLLTVASAEEIAAAEAAMTEMTVTDETGDATTGGGGTAGGSPIVGRPGNLIGPEVAADTSTDEPETTTTPTLCGMGVAAVVPLTLLGLCFLRHTRRFRGS